MSQSWQDEEAMEADRNHMEGRKPRYIEAEHNQYNDFSARVDLN